MDILTEIYRIKQVMGLITEQTSGDLVDENVYEAIKNIESVFSLTDKDGNIIPRPELNGKEKESNIKKVIKETIGLDYWKKMSPKLQGQIYSFMYQADSSENSLYRWLAGLVSAIIPDEDTPTPPVNRSDIYTNKVAILDSNGNDTGKKRILPLSELSLEKQKNIESAIKKVQDAIVNDKINYLNYMNIVKNQYENLGGTTNDAQNRIKIWAPRPEALDRLMNNESWLNVKAWWYKKIGEPDPTTQVNNASTQKDSASVNPNAVQPPIIQQQDLASANTAQPNTSAPAITNSQATPVQRSAEELKPDTFKDGEYGDPYVYIQNTSGDFLTFKCGKRNEKCLGLSNKQYNSIPWINVTKGRKAGKLDYITYENGIRVDIYGLEALPTGAEETTSTPEIIRRNVLNKFRNLFYSTYLSVIASKNLADVKKWPIKPTYKGQLDIFGDTYDVNLVGVVSSTPPKITVGAQLFTKIMDNFITKKVDVGGVQYELKAYNADAISPAESIFKRDSTGYVGDIKAENEIKSEKLGIYKVE